MRRWVLAAVLGPLALLAAPRAARALELGTDSRVELIGLVQRLSGDDLGHSRSPGGYAGRALRHFEAFRAHPAVKHLAAMRAHGFSDIVPSQYALYLSTPPGLEERYPVPELFIQAAGGQEQLDAWRAELRAFARESDFLAWYDSERADRRQLEDALRSSLQGRDLEKPVEDYLGLRSWDRLTVIPSGFFPQGGASSWVLEEKPGLPDVYVITGPEWHWGKPGFGAPAAAATSIWPEVLYSFVYVLYDICRPAIDPIADLCKATGHGDMGSIEDCVQTQWVAAVEQRLIRLQFSNSEADSALRWTRGSAYVDKLLTVLSRYEADRAKMPTLFDIGPQLAAPFEKNGAAPVCRPVDWTRLGEAPYNRHLGFYLEMEVAKDPNSPLNAALTRWRSLNTEAPSKADPPPLTH